MSDLADAAIAYLMFGWAPMGCFMVGFFYLACAPRGDPLAIRVVPAIYAPTAALLYLAVGLAPFLAGSLLRARTGFFILQAIPFALLVTSMFLFRGPKWVHGVLVPIGLACMGWQFVWAYLIVYGE